MFTFLISQQVSDVAVMGHLTTLSNLGHIVEHHATSVNRFAKPLAIFYGSFRIWHNFKPLFAIFLFAIAHIFVVINGQIMNQ